MSKATQYIKEVRAEMAHVTWPTRKQAIYFTVAVLIVSLFIAYYLGALDKIFAMGLQKLLSR